MMIEITELDKLLNTLVTSALEPHDEYKMEFTNREQRLIYEYIKQLQQENQQLKSSINQIRKNNEELKERMKTIQSKRDSYKFRYKDVCKKLQRAEKMLESR